MDSAIFRAVPITFDAFLMRETARGNAGAKHVHYSTKRSRA